jgi:hypothetical protein
MSEDDTHKRKIFIHQLVFFNIIQFYEHRQSFIGPWQICHTI